MTPSKSKMNARPIRENLVRNEISSIHIWLPNDTGCHGTQDSIPLAETEVATRRALHDGLAARQLKLAVETRHHRKVAIAVHAKAEIGEAHLLVELGVTAARHVEIQMLLGLVEDLNLEAAAARPDLLRDFSQRRDRLPIAFRPPRAILGGELADARVDDV